MKEPGPQGTPTAGTMAATPAGARSPQAAPDALAGALPAWDLLPESPVRR